MTYHLRTVLHTYTQHLPTPRSPLEHQNTFRSPRSSPPLTGPHPKSLPDPLDTPALTPPQAQSSRSRDSPPHPPADLYTPSGRAPPAPPPSHQERVLRHPWPSIDRDHGVRSWTAPHTTRPVPVPNPPSHSRWQPTPLPPQYVPRQQPHPTPPYPPPPPPTSTPTQHYS